MEIEIKIDGNYKEPKIIILTEKMSDEINLLVRKITEDVPQMIAGFQNDQLKVLEQDDRCRIYTANNKVFANTSDGDYSLRLRLYELEERLEKNDFVRISNSEIINIRKVKAFDLSFTGTICVKLIDGTVTYVSRRYVPKIKQILGI